MGLSCSVEEESRSNSKTFADVEKQNLNKYHGTMIEIDEKSNSSFIFGKEQRKKTNVKSDIKPETVSTFQQTSGLQQWNKLLPPILDMQTPQEISLSEQKNKEPEKLVKTSFQPLADIIELENMGPKSKIDANLGKDRPKIGNMIVGKRGPNSFGALLQERETKRMLISPNDGDVQIFQTRNTSSTQKLLSKYLPNPEKS